MRVAVKNVADPKQVKRASNKERDDAEQHKDDLRQILNTNWGRRFLCRLLDLTGYREESFVTKDASLTFFNEGKRSVGAHLEREIIYVDKQMYLQMLAEKMEREDG